MLHGAHLGQILCVQILLVFIFSNRLFCHEVLYIALLYYIRQVLMILLISLQPWIVFLLLLLLRFCRINELNFYLCIFIIIILLLRFEFGSLFVVLLEVEVLFVHVQCCVVMLLFDMGLGFHHD